MEPIPWQCMSLQGPHHPTTPPPIAPPPHHPTAPSPSAPGSGRQRSAAAVGTARGDSFPPASRCKTHQSSLYCLIFVTQTEIS